jgi:DNA-3-methyladenine glycosylase II
MKLMLHATNHLKSSDPILAAIIETAGPCVMSYRDPEFSTLVRSIVFQQLHGKAAATIYGRLEAAAGGTVTPQSILALQVPKLRACGLSKQKIAYIRDLAKHTTDGKIEFSKLSQKTDDEVMKALTQVKGVGAWTAHMFLIFALRRENVLPTGDLAIRAAIKRAYKTRGTRKDPLPSPKQMEKLAKAWHPYCSIASWYLWRYVEGDAEF